MRRAVWPALKGRLTPATARRYKVQILARSGRDVLLPTRGAPCTSAAGILRCDQQAEPTRTPSPTLPHSARCATQTAPPCSLISLLAPIRASPRLCTRQNPPCLYSSSSSFHFIIAVAFELLDDVLAFNFSFLRLCRASRELRELS